MIISRIHERNGTGGIFFGVRPENLRIGCDNSVRVKLRPPWAEFFADLPPLGPAFRQTRVAGVMLGQWGMYPGPDSFSDPRMSNRELLFDGVAIEAVYAFKASAYGEDCLGFEVYSHQGPVHRISIPAGEEVATFNRIVRTHQARIDLRPVFDPEAEPAEAPWQNGIRHRLDFLRVCPPEVFAKVEPNVLPTLLDMVRLEDMALRTTVYTPAVVQAAEWVPSGVECRGDTVFACNSETSLHLRPHSISTGCLTVLNCRCCDRKRATLEFFDENGRLSLAVTAADTRHDRAWFRLLDGMAR